jgi:ferredoxin
MKKRFVLTFPPEATYKPITYEVIKKYNVKINIIKARVDSGEIGYLLVELDAAQSRIRQVLEYLQENQVSYQPLEKEVIFRQEACIHCGSCVGVCFAGALVMDPETRQLEFDSGKCIVCELCTEACPLGLFEIQFGGE